MGSTWSFPICFPKSLGKLGSAGAAKQVSVLGGFVGGGSTASIDDGRVTWGKHMGVSKNRGFSPKMDGFLMENPIKMDDLGVSLFSETSI